MRKPRRLIASALSIIFFLTQCAWAHRPASSLWEDRQKSVRQETTQLASLPLALPDLAGSSLLSNANVSTRPVRLPNLSIQLPSSILQFGSIRSVSTPAKNSGRVIIHIQDIHDNTEAQSNISRAVNELAAHKIAQTIFLEGAFEPIDLKLFQNLPYRRSVERAADFMLEEKSCYACLCFAIDDCAVYWCSTSVLRKQ